MPLSAEGLLISALLNTEAVGEEVKYGISAGLFEGYADEYNWITNYVETYGCQPTRDIFSHKFPGFVFSEHADVRSAADMVHAQANRRRITVASSMLFRPGACASQASLPKYAWRAPVANTSVS